MSDLGRRNNRHERQLKPYFSHAANLMRGSQPDRFGGNGDIRNVCRDVCTHVDSSPLRPSTRGLPPLFLPSSFPHKVIVFLRFELVATDGAIYFPPQPFSLLFGLRCVFLSSCGCHQPWDPPLWFGFGRPSFSPATHRLL